MVMASDNGFEVIAVGTVGDFVHIENVTILTFDVLACEGRDSKGRHGCGKSQNACFFFIIR